MVCICLFYECVYIMSYNNNNNIIVNIYTYTYILFWIIYTIICTSCQLLLLVKKYKWQSHSIHIYFITFNWNGCHRIPFPNEHFVCFHFLLPCYSALQSEKKTELTSSWNYYYHCCIGPIEQWLICDIIIINV